jgi:LmbE family N-acetylglucosaminyl deacetylase
MMSAGIRSAATLPRRSAKFVVGAMSRAVFRALGVPAPADFAAASCLVLAPHPDDETLGCGATIARKRALGSKVSVVVVSDGNQSPRSAELTDGEFISLRRSEALEALLRLGVASDDVEFLEFEDGALTEQLPNVVIALKAIVRSRSPQQIFVTSTMDRHPDHAALGRAARNLVDDGIFSGDLFEYPIWQRIPAFSTTLGSLRSSVDRVGPPRSPRQFLAGLRPLLIRTDGYLQFKSHALAAYSSQLPHFPIGFLDDFLQQFEVFVAVPRREADRQPSSSGRPAAVGGTAS